MVHLRALNRQILRGSTPPWVVVLLDTALVAISLMISYLLRFNFQIPVAEIRTFPWVFPIVLAVRVLLFLIARTYVAIFRYTSARDAEKILLTVLAGSALFAGINLLNYYILHRPFLLPFSVLIIEYLVTTFLLISIRVMVKTLYYEIQGGRVEKRNVIIYGAGESGVIAKRTIDRDVGARYKVLAFIDDDMQKEGKTIEGIKIYHTSDLEKLLEHYQVAHIIVSIQKITPSRINAIADIAIRYNTKVLHVPPVRKWINGELSFKQIKKVRIEDLLGREPIELDKEHIRQEIFGKTILITGAAGSIGSEIARQVLSYNPHRVILLDQAETSLYELQIEIEQMFHSARNVEYVIADITEKERMEKVFSEFHPQKVFHAAAYKHVPLMEDNPCEAVWVNVYGTKIVADLALKYQANRFVMISTDKAVNPTNVMGASKRIAEIYTQLLNGKGVTRFITTRFGNVLGSNGSVIPLFRKQIENGGPVTITHPEITRFFMTIPEACQLVLEAGVMGNGGEIFVFDMGERIKIVDLAKKMIKLSGLTLGKDIQIVYTGLRPGEKLHEELLNNSENTIPTHHPRILKAKTAQMDPQVMLPMIEELIAMVYYQDDMNVVRKMKEIVPEFISNNSVYAELDRK